jgi:small-conductance mechanosensitive channel
MNQFWHRVVFSIMGYEIRGEHLIELASLFALLLAFDWLLTYWGLPAILRKFPTEAERQRQVTRRLQPLILFCTLLFWVWFSGIDPQFYKRQGHWIGLSTLLQGLVIWQIARLSDLIIGRVILRGFFKKQERQKRPFLLGGQAGVERDWKVSNRYIKYVTYTLAALLLIRLFRVDLLLHQGKLGKVEYHLYISNLLIAALVILIAQLLTWLIVHLFLTGFYRRRRINIGAQYAINRLINYFIYFIAALIALHLLGVNITVIAGGAVALLVGVGIGLQQTFNDFFSGILLLFERSIEVADWVEIDGLVGKVMRIGLRTSIVQTRDNRSVIVPNSKLVVNNVTSWSHGDDVARFNVAVGVAYGSDTELVKNLLLRAAAEQPKVMENPAPFVRMVQFGNSSLDFEIHFWTDEFMFIEDLRSDIRFSIDRLFRENNIVIPFPQSDIWIKSMPNNPPAFE